MKQLKRILSIFLVALMLVTTAPLTGLDSIFTPKASAYSVGDHIQYGNYPQSKVTDSSTLALLNSMTKNWISYKYYSGSGEIEDGQMAPADYMYYADLDTNGDGLRDYRAVRIDKYRQKYTGYTAGGSDTYQSTNGYTQGNTYYFKFEPISWRILDPSSGLILTEKIMDSQAYNNYILQSGTAPEDEKNAYYGDSSKTYYANDYYNSSIRKWLNEDFYNTAFNSTQAKNIRNDVTLNNNCYSSSYPQYNSQASKDKMFLLSYDEAKTSAYGFSSNAYDEDTNRSAQGTDYAKSQGLYVMSSPYNGNSWWWLRSPCYNSYIACDVYINGKSISIDYVYYTYGGIRVACRLSNLTSDISQSKIGNDMGSGAEGGVENLCDHENTILKDAIDSTCTTDGYTGDKICVECGETIETGEVINAFGHTPDIKMVEKSVSSNCNTVYDVIEYCSVCSEELNIKTVTIDGNKHDYEIEYNAPTCTTSGTIILSCKNCSEVKETIIPALNHNYISTVIEPTCTKGGFTKHTCSNCGYEIIDSQTNALGHSMRTQTILPTCTENGCDIEICEVCSYNYETNIVKAKGHMDANRDDACDECGLFIGTTIDPGDKCSHMCHKSGFSGFIWKIVNLFNKLFKTNKTCSCGVAHW